MGSALGYFLEVRLGGESIVYMLLLMLANMGFGMGSVWHLLRGGVPSGPAKLRGALGGGAGPGSGGGGGRGRGAVGAVPSEQDGLLSGQPFSNGSLELTPDAKISKRKTTLDDF